MDNNIELITKYLEHGLVLVPFKKGLKGPREQGWNLEKNCIKDISKLDALKNKNIGLAHAYNSTCAIDIDDFSKCSEWLEKHGIDIAALLMAEDGVQISSGRDNRAKLIYRIEKPLPTKKLDDIKLEFRCATQDGLTVQDVLPPSIHPDTKKPYTWIGNWENIPEIPEPLLKLWESILGDSDQFKDDGGKIQFGNRDEMAYKKACSLFGKGLNFDQVYGALEYEFFPRIEQPRNDKFTKKDLMEKVKSASRYEDGEKSDVDSKDKQDSLILFAHEIMREEIKQTWLFKDYLLFQPQIVEIYGEPGAGKSLIALDLSLCISAYQSWAGITPEIPGFSFYIYGEGRANLKKRMKAWEKNRGLDLGDWIDIPFAATRGSAQIGGDNWRKDDAAKMLADEIEKNADKYGDPKLITIDTVDRNLVGDENSTKDMRNFLQSIDANMVQRFQCTALILHHPGHKEKERSRGASNLKGAIDAQFKVKENDNIISFGVGIKPPRDYDVPKTRYFKKNILKFTNNDRSSDYTGAALEYIENDENISMTNKKGIGQHAEKAMKILENGICPMHHYVWRSGCKELGINPQQFRDARNTLINRGKIKIENEMVFIL